ncbi:hypothetical protein [Novilysobacter spongiicola]|uniref:Uncharacterized protein n=1 Tax=Lysobacter spongiicola DSM 21749 TaxID=1122188 RepID=A0A1T4P0U4_9GAMM|nr:hypothetical protein [Lysobacter spongiicola]MDX1549741.1 hypothetical protein [Lysobacter spongiicola]SJZ85002.1 hypothetical protein SAMN02745674_01018 [Lysobacter spongiicola DSM 21749]
MDNNGYAIFFFPQAIEALGEAIKPYLQGEGDGAHVICRNVDTGGALAKMVLDGRTTSGAAVELELMVPTSMVRMVVSARSDESFGFGPRIAVESTRQASDGKPVVPDPEATPGA